MLSVQKSGVRNVGKLVSEKAVGIDARVWAQGDGRILPERVKVQNYRPFPSSDRLVCVFSIIFERRCRKMRQRRNYWSNLTLFFVLLSLPELEELFQQPPSADQLGRIPPRKK